MGACALLSVACVIEEAPAKDNDVASETQDVAPIACMTHSACPSGQACGFAPGTCGDLGGVCQPAALTQACTGTPICGCDGIEYGDSCAAWQSGVSVWFDGTCEVGQQSAPPPPPPPEDCATGCSNSEFCFSEDGSCGASTQGICRERAGVCTSSTNPVCGCDGVTYQGICDAVQSGVSVAHSGGC